VALSVCAALTSTGIYGFFVHKRIKDVDGKKIAISRSIPESFRHSLAVKDIANPRQYRDKSDSRVITLEIPAHHQNVSDEYLLSLFVKGFFGGLVIGPERLVLRTLRPSWVHFTSK